MNIPALVAQQGDPARVPASESSNQAVPTATTTPDEPPLRDDDEERLQCTHEGCDRSFKKAAHLKRHMKSHDSAPSFECASCGKKFMRRDVLVRHTSSVHGIVTKHRKPSCVNCALQKLKCDGDQDDKCKRCDHLQLECVYKQPKSSSRASEPPRKRARTSPSSPERDPSEAGSLPSVESSAHPVQHLAPAIMPPPPLFHHQPTPSTSTSRRPLPPPATNVPEASPFASTSSAAPAYLAQRPAPQPASPLWQPAYNFSAERTSAALSNMAPFDFLPNIIDPSADVAASFDASAGWGLGDTELDLVGMFDLGGDPANGARPTVPAQAGYETPVDWLRLLGSFRESSAAAPAAPTPGVAPSGAPAGLPSLSQAPPPPPPPQGLPRRESLAGVSPHATLRLTLYLQPHVYQPVAPVGPLSLPTVPNPPPPLVFEQPGATVTSQVRAAMIQLVSESHQSPWAGIALDSFPSASVLSICLKLYLSRFHATFPILDPASLETASSSPLLLLACAAVGAMYRADFEGLGVALTEIVRRTTLWMREQDPRASFELEVVQAWLVSSIAGLFCGSRKLYQHAEIARCGLLTAARRMELLRETPSCVDELCSRKAPEPYELAAARREDELRLRLGWGCYVFDNLVASLLHLQPVVSIEEIAATTLLPSESFAPDPQGRVRFRATLAALLNDGRIEQPLTPFSTLITQLSLYRLCLDASNLSTVLAGVIPTTRLGTYRLSFSPDIRHNPQELLDRIGSAWHSSSVNVTSLHVMATALAYHAALQFSCGDFLSQAKVCAGKYGGDRAARAREWVRRKAETDPVAVRRVLARALQLNALLVRHRFDTPPETIWLADSALAVWAIITFAGRTLTDTPTALQVVTTIKWNDPGNSAEPWIQCGGPLSLRSGLGEYGSATPGSVLRKFSEHLEDLPWGLSRKYRAVLLQLSQEE